MSPVTPPEYCECIDILAVVKFAGDPVQFSLTSYSICQCHLFSARLENIFT